VSIRRAPTGSVRPKGYPAPSHRALHSP
jgi:hypothetical protein